MASYFGRLRAATCPGGPAPLPPQAGVRTDLDEDGVYLHKRPIRGPNGGPSPLAVCGSVLHHVLVYVKQGEEVHCLDYGPANGADVTANVFEAAPAKRVWSRSTTEAVAAEAAAEAEAVTAPAGAAGGAGGGGSSRLPYLYLGPAARPVPDPLVQETCCCAY
eukprot:XP_001695225.1 predicted protein [Chlamydomonas reinhardtii]